jgi:hypothetical protein
LGFSPFLTTVKLPVNSSGIKVKVQFANAAKVDFHRVVSVKAGFQSLLINLKDLGYMELKFKFEGFKWQSLH